MHGKTAEQFSCMESIFEYKYKIIDHFFLAKNKQMSLETRCLETIFKDRGLIRLDCIYCAKHILTRDQRLQLLQLYS